MVLKNTLVENAPRTSIEKHLSWSSDIPPAARFPPHRSRPAGYQPNRQSATVGAEERRGGRGTTSRRTTTRTAPELSPPKPAYVGNAVLHTITRGTVPMGQCDGCHRGQHLTVHISINDLHCCKPARRWHHCSLSTPTLPPTLPQRPPHYVSRTHNKRMSGRQMSCRQQTAPPHILICPGTDRVSCCCSCWDP